MVGSLVEFVSDKIIQVLGEKMESAIIKAYDEHTYVTEPAVPFQCLPYVLHKKKNSPRAEDGLAGRPFTQRLRRMMVDEAIRENPWPTGHEVQAEIYYWIISTILTQVDTEELEQTIANFNNRTNRRSPSEPPPSPSNDDTR